MIEELCVGPPAPSTWLPDYGADNTGTNYNNEQFAAAFAAVATAGEGQSGGVVLTGPPGVYKLRPLAIPLGVAFGGFGTKGAARFWIAEETGLPSAIGFSTGSYSLASTSLSLAGVKNTFAPASAASPQSVSVGGILTYTGSTGSGANVTLTGIQGLTPTIVDALNAGAAVIGNTAILCAGSIDSGGYTLDASIEVWGPQSGGAAWMTDVPPAAMDGVFLGGRGAIDCAVVGFRHAAISLYDHEQLGPNFSPRGCYSFLCLESPNIPGYAGVVSGNQYAAPGIDWHGAYWAAVYVTAYNQLLNATFYGGNSGSFSPWHFWKEATHGVSGANEWLMQDTSVYDHAFESPGFGIMGCPDGNALVDAALINCSVGWDGAGATRPPGSSPIAEFAVNLACLNVKGGNLFSTTNPEGEYPGTPFVSGSIFIGSTDQMPAAMAGFLEGRKVLQANPGVVYGEPITQFAFPGGVIVNGANTTAPAAGDVVAAFAGVNPAYPGAQYCGKDNGEWYMPIGVAIASFAGANVGPVATGPDWGQLPVNVHAPGDIRQCSWVQSNGAVAAGTAKSAAWPGTTEIIGWAITADSGGKALILVR